jgi:cytochrome c biogenesis protein
MPPVRKTTRTALRKSGGRSWLWSKDGQDVQKKEIVVNDPLLYSGVRFYQSSYGPNGKVDKLSLVATPSNGSGQKQEIGLTVNDTVPLDADTTVRFAEFLPDFAVRDGQVYKKSNYLDNPAAHLVVTSKKPGKTSTSGSRRWTRSPTTRRRPTSSRPPTLKMGHFTGLQVSHEPGQWGVWSGVVLMGIGLAFVFYVVHMRFWVVPVRDPKRASARSGSGEARTATATPSSSASTIWWRRWKKN